MTPRRKYPLYPIPGVAVHIKKDDTYLLIKRVADPDKGFWSVPGGLIEVGERAVEAAEREVREETGLSVELLKRLGVYDKIELDPSGKVLYHFIIMHFQAQPLGGDLTPMDDALDSVWVRKEQFNEYQLTHSLQMFLKRIGFTP